MPIFGKVDVFYILIEFEVDGMRPNESTKNGRKAAHGLNCKIFVNSKVFFEINEKNYIKVFSFLIVIIQCKKNFPVMKNMNSLVKKDFSVLL